MEHRLLQKMQAQKERLTCKLLDMETRLLRWNAGAFAALAVLLTLFEYII